MKREGIVTFGGRTVTLDGSPVAPGDYAPDFVALNNSLEPVTLSNFEGKKRLISVMPSVDTGVCSAQTRRFNEEASKHPDTVVITVSMDLPFALKRFCAAEGIENAVTLSYHRDCDCGMKYGFLMDELRLLARGVVVIDSSGYIRHVEYVSEVSEHPDYDKALKVLREI